MTPQQALNLVPNQLLFVREVTADPDHPGAVISHNVSCNFFKMLGEHVVVRIYGNIYLTLTPEEVHKP
jgi:hypothetical protein